jgi:hypothetical protein
VKKLGKELVTTTPNGTWLTGDGRALLNIYQRYSEMLEESKNEFSVYCTPISYTLVKKALLPFELQGKPTRISVNSDQQNLKALYLGRAKLVIFDDPVYAMEFEGLKDEKVITIDLFSDTLVHVDSGQDYIKYKYGAQRLGFRYLESVNITYTVHSEVSDLDYLLNSGKSFFLNRSFMLENGLDLKSTTEPEIFKHPIMAVSIDPTEDTSEIISRLKKQKDVDGES